MAKQDGGSPELAKALDVIMKFPKGTAMTDLIRRLETEQPSRELVKRLRERASAARTEGTATALGDAIHFEEAAALLEQQSRTIAALQAQGVPRPIEEWHEDMGPKLWWKFPVDEKPFCGSPLGSDWPGYHTHFTDIPLPEVSP